LRNSSERDSELADRSVILRQERGDEFPDVPPEHRYQRDERSVLNPHVEVVFYVSTLSL